MTHTLSFLERLRVRLAVALHAQLVKRGYYAEGPAREISYACTVAKPYSEFEADLHALGFVRNVASSLKYRETPITDREIEVASWAYFPEGPAESEYMLHLDLFVGPDADQTDVYAHYEPSWITNPIRHYRAQEVDSALGVRLTRERFTAAGIEYTTVPIEVRYGPPTAAAP